MERPNPSEFVAFMRDSAKRALDSISDRVKELDKPIRNVVRSWSKLDAGEKDSLLDELIASWMNADETPKTKRSVKDVEKTLPKKPRKKSAKKSASSKKK